MMDKIVWFVNNAYKYEEELISWRFTLCATACYLVAVLLGQRFMKNRTGWGLKTAMTVHNVILFVWSLVMFSAGVYEAIKAFSQHPFLDVYCAAKIRPGSDRIMTGSVWFWIWLFFISKFYEFADTGFIILRKSKLIFLHVYHHAIVAPLGITYLKAGMIFLLNGVIWNGGIHTAMYWSYLMTSMGHPPKWKKYLTMAQLVQFVWGVSSTLPLPYVCGYGYFTLTYPTIVFWFQEFVLVTFYLLFAAFYNDRYDAGKKPAAAAVNGATSNTNHVVNKVKAE